MSSVPIHPSCSNSWRNVHDVWEYSFSFTSASFLKDYKSYKLVIIFVGALRLRGHSFWFLINLFLEGTYCAKNIIQQRKTEKKNREINQIIRTTKLESLLVHTIWWRFFFVVAVCGRFLRGNLAAKELSYPIYGLFCNVGGRIIWKFAGVTIFLFFRTNVRLQHTGLLLVISSEGLDTQTITLWD